MRPSPARQISQEPLVVYRTERGEAWLGDAIETLQPFGEWTKVFPDPRLAKAVVDRITHKAHIIDTGTESWRFRHGLQQHARGRT